jgi:hypothetical protein
MRTLLVAAAVSLPNAVAADDVDPRKFGWHVDYATAKAEAKRNGKPLLVVFRCEP